MYKEYKQYFSDSHIQLLNSVNIAINLVYCDKLYPSIVLE